MGKVEKIKKRIVKRTGLINKFISYFHKIYDELVEQREALEELQVEIADDIEYCKSKEKILKKFIQ